MSPGHQLVDVVDRFMGELRRLHRIAGWEHAAGDLRGTSVGIRLRHDRDDTAIRQSALALARTVPGVERIELLDRDPLAIQRS